MPFDLELDTAIRAAHRAGRLIRQHAGQLQEGAVRQKGANDLVTEIDERAQQLIVETLLETFPDDEILGEEGGDLEAAARSTGGRRWIIDPIDGTTNFTHGYAPYCVSIGLQQEDDVVVGVILDVPGRELFTAVRGGGLRVNGAPAGVSAANPVGEALVINGLPYRVRHFLDEYLAVLRRFILLAQSVRRSGAAALDLAHVACGRADVFFETGLHPWDVAAGALLVEEGGGRVTDYHDEHLPLFTEQLVATNGHLHAEVLEMVAELRDA